MMKKAEIENEKEMSSELASVSVKLISCEPIKLQLKPANYPKYILTPLPAGYSVYTEDFNVTLNYTEVLPNGTEVYVSKTFPSKRLYIVLNNHLYPTTTFVLENTAVFKKILEQNLILSNQRMITEDYVRFVVLKGNVSISSNIPTDLALIPISYGGKVYVKNLTISFDSICSECWEEFFSNSKVNITVKGSKVVITLNGSTILSIAEYMLKQGIGISLEINEQRIPYRVVKLNPFDTYNLTVGESKEFGVAVLDYYNNPVPGIDVNVTVSGGIGVVTPEKTETDVFGRAYVEFRALSSGSGDVIFSTPVGNATYHVNVYAPPLGGGGGSLFTVEWLDKLNLDSYYGNVWDVGNEGNLKTLTLRVTYNGEPISNANVTFLVTNESVLELDRTYGITDANGEVTVTAFAKANGTVKVFGFCEGSGDVLNLTITNVTTSWYYYNWLYRKPINITSSVAVDDYQILILNPIYNENGLVLSLHFEESGDYAFDYSGFSRHGKLVGLSGVNTGNPPIFSDGKFDRGLYFDGGGAVKLDYRILNGLTQVTFTAWIKTNKSGSFAIISGADSYEDNEYLLYFSDPDTVYTYIEGRYRWVNLPSPINDDKWHFIAWVWDGSRSKVYIDGNLVLNRAQPGGALDIDPDGLWLGQEQDSVGDRWDEEQAFVGYMDEVKIYARALSEEEILALYNAKVKPNYYDVRFTYYDGSKEVKIPYWMESDGRFWIKVPHISGTVTCYIYYGNPNVTTKSNGGDVFIFFDDFDNWNGWTNYGSGSVSQYKYNGDYVLEKSDNCDPNGGYKLLGTTVSNFKLIVKERRDAEGSDCPYDRYGLEDDNWNGYGIYRKGYTTSTGYFGWERRDNANGVNQHYTILNQPYKDWYITELKRYGSSINATLYKGDRTLIGYETGSDSSYSSFDRVVIRGGRPYYVEWIAVANYVEPEPTYTIGAEENR
jgi:hypothetical protein